ncbi:MAG: hypothetical protein ABR521_08625 [Gaiellaceae bacterium]
MQAGSAAVVLLLTTSCLAVSKGASARTSKVDGSKSPNHTVEARGGEANQSVPPAFLVAVTERDAALLDDPVPTSASFVLGTEGDTAKLGMGFSPHSADRPAYFVVLTGTFVYDEARGPPGKPTPKGTVAILVVSVALGQPIGLALRSSPVDLAQIGPVGDLMPYLRRELTAACGGADLKATASFYNGARTALIGAIRLASRSSHACALPKAPRVLLTWKDQRWPWSGTQRLTIPVPAEALRS